VIALNQLSSSFYAALTTVPDFNAIALSILTSLRAQIHKKIGLTLAILAKSAYIEPKSTSVE
jgi:hypothetical protein